jgi:hypothetical protein
MSDPRTAPSLSLPERASLRSPRLSATCSTDTRTWSPASSGSSTSAKVEAESFRWIDDDRSHEYLLYGTQNES